ncbi:MAG: methylenetetrahydrofolate reductase [NAD(P)H] [Holosporaceae bacterium]|jgi:methylenetetrahydrofolate reductase (NADPH)|nr:methylenetetrahydrofolate reductase [NAD(P)H] [Holosporaceae bacterium]
MYISELFQKKKCLFSHEIFPPQKETDVGKVYETIASLQLLRPDFISVTCGAGGSAVGDNITAKIAHHIKKEYGIESLVHLTCVNSSRSSMEETLAFLRENDLYNILALRGDRTQSSTAADFAYASDLISLIKQKKCFYIAAACHPEGHPESSTKEENIRHLKEKVDAGASHLISQLFFDNDAFYVFLDEIGAANITIPVEAGIMPIVNKRLIDKIVTLCGASSPPKFLEILNRFGNSPASLFDAGIDYATEQIVDLISHGVRGIHLYTMNNPVVAERITKNIRGVLEKINGEPS